eukprot:scaffold12973_cov117-Isochrysis_galbana.AAC.6
MPPTEKTSAASHDGVSSWSDSPAAARPPLAVRGGAPAAPPLRSSTPPPSSLAPSSSPSSCPSLSSSSSSAKLTATSESSICQLPSSPPLPVTTAKTCLAPATKKCCANKAVDTARVRAAVPAGSRSSVPPPPDRSSRAHASAAPNAPPSTAATCTDTISGLRSGRRCAAC